VKYRQVDKLDKKVTKKYGVGQVAKKITLEGVGGKETRVRVAFYPDHQKRFWRLRESKATIAIEVAGVDDHVDKCMTKTECLGILGDDMDNAASLKLRNDNRFQLDCLEGKSMSGELQNKCDKWDGCVSGDKKHKQTVVAFLRAGLGGDSGSLNQGAVAANVTAAAIDPNTCVDPVADDAESWGCECLDDMVSDCRSSDDSLEVCLRLTMCKFDVVCRHWKEEHCPNSMFQKKSTDSSAMQMRRQVITKSDARSASDSELDGTVKGKCNV